MAQVKPPAEAKKVLSVTRKRIYFAIIIVGNALAFYLIYTSLFAKPSTPTFVTAPSTITPTATEQAVAVGGNNAQSFLDQLTRDVSILTDSRFRLLRSLGIEIKAPPAGRENPFVPYK